MSKNPDLPTGESTQPVGWSPQWPTVQQFRVTLQGSASFDGRQVKETQGFGTPQDTCYFDGSPYSPFGVTGGSWVVGYYATPPLYIYTDTWIDDYIGYAPEAVTYYRANQKAPCDGSAEQWMNIHRNGNSGLTNFYRSDYIGAGITVTDVYSSRDGHYASRQWP